LRAVAVGRFQPSQVEEAFDGLAARTPFREGISERVVEAGNGIASVSGEQEAGNRGGGIPARWQTCAGINPSGHDVDPLHGLRLMPVGIGEHTEP
jgi:hypothetical protein